jgi:hypothetical protein
MERAQEIRENLDLVRSRIAAACARTGRDPAAVRLVGVSKFKSPEDVAAAVAAGLSDAGENYAQELVAKAAAVAALGPSPRWHFLGGLQSNKVRQVVPIVAGLQSVDRPSLVDELARRVPADASLEVFVEVNVGGEAQKSGAAPGDVEALCRRLLAIPGVRLAGLMCVPPIVDDPEASRPYFRDLRALRDRIRAALDAPAGVLEGLSMGMSYDFEVAIEEGATTVRVGTALFGERTGRP